MQLLHFTFYHGHLLHGKFRCIFMIRIALVMPHVPRQLTLGFLSFVLLTAKIAIAFFLLLVQVALVVASCGASMFLPVTHADPAEFVATLIAGHVVATLVLLDRFVAARTRFCVCHDPGHILGLGVDFYRPGFCSLTGSRSMRA